MIRLIEDLNGLVSLATDDVISSIADYVSAYEKIIKAFAEGHDLTLYVRHATVMRWFSQMSSRYPNDSFMIECIDARCRLEELWDISIPKDVSSEEIIGAGLLDLNISPPDGAHFDNILLEHFYHPIFAEKNFPFARLCDLIMVYNSAKWDDNAKNQLICRTYSKCLVDWKTKAKNSDLKRLIDLFSADVDALKGQLMKYKILSVSLRINQSYIFKSCIFSILCCDSVPPNFMNTIYHNIVDI